MESLQFIGSEELMSESYVRFDEQEDFTFSLEHAAVTAALVADIRSSVQAQWRTQGSGLNSWGVSRVGDEKKCWPNVCRPHFALPKVGCPRISKLTMP